jgi:hypothetical protein
MSDTYQNFPSTIVKLTTGHSLTNGTYSIGASNIAQFSSNLLLVRNYGDINTIIVLPEEYDYVKTGQKFRLAMLMGADRNSGHNFTTSAYSSHPSSWGGDYICNVSSDMSGEISIDVSLNKISSINNTNWTIYAVFNYSGDGSANGPNSEAWYSIKGDNSISGPAGDYQGIGGAWAHGVYRYQATQGLTTPHFQTIAGDTGESDTEKPIISLTGDAEITLTEGATYTEQGATWTDNVDGAGDATASGSVDTSTVGTYTITYNYTDAAGNASNAVTRSVTVISDEFVVGAQIRFLTGKTWANGDVTPQGTITQISSIGTTTFQVNVSGGLRNISMSIEGDLWEFVTDSDSDGVDDTIDYFPHDGTYTQTKEELDAYTTAPNDELVSGDIIRVLQTFSNQSGQSTFYQGEYYVAVNVDNPNGRFLIKREGDAYRHVYFSGANTRGIDYEIVKEVAGSPPAAFSVPDLIVNENTAVNHEVSPSGGDWTTTVTNLMSPLTLSGNYIVGTTQEVPGYKNVTVSVAQTATVTRTNSYGSTSAQLDILVLNTTEEPTDTGGNDTGIDTSSILYQIGQAVKAAGQSGGGSGTGGATGTFADFQQSFSGGDDGSNDNDNDNDNDDDPQPQTFKISVFDTEENIIGRTGDDTGTIAYGTDTNDLYILNNNGFNKWSHYQDE